MLETEYRSASTSPNTNKTVIAAHCAYNCASYLYDVILGAAACMNVRISFDKHRNKTKNEIGKTKITKIRNVQRNHVSRRVSQ